MYSVAPITEKILSKNSVHDRITLSMERIIRLLKYKARGDLEINDAFDNLQQICELLQNYFDDLYAEIINKLIYPLFEKSKYESIIKILRKQYSIGIDLIEKIIELCGATHDSDNISLSIRYVSIYIHMTNGLKTRENTIIVNLLRKIMSPEEFINLSYEMKKKINEVYGKKWRKTLMKDLIEIEKKLGVDNLGAYVPIMDTRHQKFLDDRDFVTD